MQVYFDNNATTCVDPRVVEAMLPYFATTYGNAASLSHGYGQEALRAVDRSRDAIAEAIHARDPKEIVFTSGATESDNLALKGVAAMYRDRGDHIITCQTEHKAVLDTCKRLENQGFRVTCLRTCADGLLDLDELARAISERTILISVMQVNNETGVIQDIAAIGRMCRERGVLFHTDATQSLGKVPLDVQTMHVDLASFSAHKLYGPKGVGGLYVRRREPAVRLDAQTDGGGHERGMRSGTLNVPGIVGFGHAVTLCSEEMGEASARLRCLRERLLNGLQCSIGGVIVNGHPTQRAPGTLNVRFEGVDGETLITALPDVALSSGSACTSASLTPSHVLSAMGLSDREARSSVLFSLGRFNTEGEVDYVISRCTVEVERLKHLSRSGI